MPVVPKEVTTVPMVAYTQTVPVSVLAGLLITSVSHASNLVTLDVVVNAATKI